MKLIYLLFWEEKTRIQISIAFIKDQISASLDQVNLQNFQRPSSWLKFFLNSLQFLRKIIFFIKFKKKKQTIVFLQNTRRDLKLGYKITNIKIIKSTDPGCKITSLSPRIQNHKFSRIKNLKLLATIRIISRSSVISNSIFLKIWIFNRVWTRLG